MVYTKNTWKTDDIITADKLNNLESGLDNTNPRQATFTDFADVAKDMNKYAGNWYVTGSTKIANDPVSSTGGLNWYQVIVTPSFPGNNGNIQIEVVNGNTFNTGVSSGALSGWNLIPKDSAVVHNTGTETVAGNKTFSGSTNFTGQTTLKTGNYGLRVTTSGIQKTSDGGTTWVNI